MGKHACLFARVDRELENIRIGDERGRGTEIELLNELRQALIDELEKRVQTLARYHRQNIRKFRELGEDYDVFEKWSLETARAEIEKEAS